MAYKSYTADLLKVLAEANGAKINKRFFDIIEELNKPKDNRSGEEIAAEVIEKCGLVVIDG